MGKVRDLPATRFYFYFRSKFSIDVELFSSTFGGGCRFQNFVNNFLRYKKKIIRKRRSLYKYIDDIML